MGTSCNVSMLGSWRIFADQLFVPKYIYRYCLLVLTSLSVTTLMSFPVTEFLRRTEITKIKLIVSHLSFLVRRTARAGKALWLYSVDKSFICNKMLGT